MPWPAIIGVAGGLIQSALQSRENRRSQQFSSDMYDRQYQNNLKFWELQNEYNTPANQIKRLEEAGLNKQSLFGKTGGSIAGAGSAGDIKTPDVLPAQFRAPDVSSAAVPAISAIADLRVKNARTDLMQAQLDTEREQAALTEAKTMVQQVLRADTQDKLDEWNHSHMRTMRFRGATMDLALKVGQDEINQWNRNLKDQLYYHLKTKNLLERNQIRANINWLQEQTAYKAYLTKILRAFGPYGPVIRSVAGAIVTTAAGYGISRLVASRVAAKAIPTKSIKPLVIRRTKGRIINDTFRPPRTINSRY